MKPYICSIVVLRGSKPNFAAFSTRLDQTGLDRVEPYIHTASPVLEDISKVDPDPIFNDGDTDSFLC